MQDSLTESIASFCSDVVFSDLDESTVQKAKMSIIDTYGVIYTGLNQSVSDILVKWVKDKNSAEESSVFGYNFKTSVSNSALINGTMGHAVDFDDVSSPLRGHPSVVIFPVVMAVGEKLQSSGQDLITAFTLGVELMAKLAKYINPSHYIKGWHSTSTLGVMAASVAAGRLYGFDQKKMKTVLALAASMASGMRLNFGTMTKPFHVGYAAKNGIEAAQLVQLGWTASGHIFDTDINFLNLYSGQKVTVGDIDDWGNPWDIDNPGFNIKRYPCCYATHRSADAVENILKKNNFNFEQIKKVECLVPNGGTAPLIYSRPKTGLEGKFSMQYVIAAMLVDKQIKLDTFTDEKVRRGVIQNLLPKIHSKETPEIRENRDIGDLGYTHLKIILKDATIIEEKVYYARGSFKKPLTEQQLFEKFSDCLYPFRSSKIENGFNKLMIIEKINNINTLLDWEETAS